MTISGIDAGVEGAASGRTPLDESASAFYRGGPPPPPRTLWDILEATAADFPRAAAIDDAVTVLDYAGLRREVRQLRRRLSLLGVGPGDRIGVRVPSGTADLYVAVLAVLAAGAAYVPVDMDDPDDRADLVWSEAGVCAVLGPRCALTRRAVQPIGAGGRRPRPDDDAWIIFTSGTTGTPKGVVVTHRSAAAFVDAEAKLFLQHRPLGPGDRVLAGLSVAFDASCEEMWLAWRHGACLVPAPRSVMRTGPEVGTWLRRRGISAVSTVPTMASMWPVDDLRGVRLLILGGEACPQELADRLSENCPEVWNTYGPTEATVVASARRLRPHEPVRIGLPLDGGRLAVVRPQSGELLTRGEVGELTISGVGLARYLDAERDAATFAPLPALGWDRAYRTGDLVRADAEGLVYLGRGDTQVKIRGYRIEPSEIESVLLQMPDITQAVVVPHEPLPGLVELAAYYTVRDGVPRPDRDTLHQQLRQRLPAHLVPAYLEQLPLIPLLRSGKADRDGLPRPTHRCGTGRAYAAPASAGERALAEAMADVLNLERVSVDSHLFDDLGANSLLIAHFCARVRQRGDVPPVSTKDVYLHPTIRALAQAVADGSAGQGPAAAPPPLPAAVTARTRQLVGCGTAQLVASLALVCLGALAASLGYGWLSAANDVAGIYLRSLVVGTLAFALLSTLPILAKWTLVGRWQAREIPVWSMAYVRFWLVKTLIRANPLALYTGSPLYVLYLRALGARVGRRVVIFSRTVPVCTDLLVIGDDTVILKGSSFTGYRAASGLIRTGPVTIGRGAFIGESTVLDVGASMGDDSQLGHSSCLYGTQAIPAGQHWHGSPAQPTPVDYLRVEPAGCGPFRRASHAAVQLLGLLVVLLPAAETAAVLALTRLPVLTELGQAGPGGITTWTFLGTGLLTSLVLFVGSLLAGFAVITTIPRLLARLITPGRTYPLYGVRYWAHRTIRLLTNAPFYLELTGDSFLVVHYLRAIGFRLPDVEQTGSNFGAALRHENPFLVTIGRGTMIADGGSLINAEYSTSSFRVTPLSVGARSFLGNAIAYPCGGRTGDNCLIGTRTMIPLDGPVHEGVGLLGSPCFEIPRSVLSDRAFDHLRTGAEFRRRLAAKNRHNLVTMGLFLMVRWVHVLIVTLVSMAAWSLYGGGGAPVLAGLAVVVLLISIGYFTTVERLVLLRPLRPRFCSIYDPHFWWHERYWKMLTPYTGMFNGTPFKNLLWRLVGVRLGRRVFDDGCAIPERTLVTIGDDCTLNTGTTIQCHSMEDGAFKSDHTVIGAGCTLGTGTLVHYGVTVGDGAQLEPDSFLLKGETMPPGARWGGNPARQL